MTDLDDAEVTPALSLDDILGTDTGGLLDAIEKPARVTSSDRLERAFLEIVEFRRLHNRLPSAATREIAERKLGARLEGILANEQKIEALRHLDEDGLLEALEPQASLDELLDGDALDDLLGDDAGLLDVSDLPTTKRPESADSIGKRIKAEDFERFDHLFKAKHTELANGTMQLVPFAGLDMIKEGVFFVLAGVMGFVADIGDDVHLVVGGKPKQKQRLRVVFENGTESDMYRQSLMTRLYEQRGQIVARAGIELDEILDTDIDSGHIYVLRSLSSDPQIARLEHLHKIGFTTGTVEKRIANAHTHPTYLMAPVEILEDYRTYNLKASALEHLLHRVFADVRLNISQIDRKGRNYDPSEWFLVPRPVIDQAVRMIMSGDIVHYRYNAEAGELVAVMDDTEETV